MTRQPAAASHREAFAMLAARLQLSGLDQRLIDAFGRLAAGNTGITDGALTISNLCAEARTSRASYYRSPVAAVVKEILTAGHIARPEIETLRDQVQELKRVEQRLRRDHAAEVRDLKATMATYANQIQALALRNAELETDNARLRGLPVLSSEKTKD